MLTTRMTTSAHSTSTGQVQFSGLRGAFLGPKYLLLVHRHVAAVVVSDGAFL